MSSPIRTRFAPSPTGFLHVGGARTALFNWLFARHHGGRFVLRIEDTDAARNTGEARAAILDGLRWLGIDWDEGPEAGGDFGPYLQSERGAIHEAHLEKLLENDLAYEDEGAIRFRVPDREISVDDAICGSQSVNLHAQGSTRWDPEAKKDVAANPDLVIRRPDGSFIFHFVNVIDDITMGITHVIRGEDHLSNTPKHVALTKALGESPPVYAHIPLILNPDGSKMSKRDAGASVDEYQRDGFLPTAVTNYLCLLGWSPKDDSERMELAEIVERFDLDGINRANAKFDLEKCTWLNGQYLADLEPATLAGLLKPHLPEGTSEEQSRDLASLFGTKIRVPAEIADAAAPLLGDDFEEDTKAIEKLAGREDAVPVLEALAEKFDQLMLWEPDQIEAALDHAASDLGLKRGALMFPCRIGASSRGGGPDLIPMLAFLGKERTVSRLRVMAERIG